MAQENLFPLKLLVFSMAALLIGGVLLLGGIVWHKAGENKCPGGEADISEHGAVAQVFSGKEGLQVVTHPAKGEMKILTIDPCTGKVRAATTLKTQK